MQTADSFMPTVTYTALIAALVAAASTLTDLPELIDVNTIKIALGEVGGIFPDLLDPNRQESDENDA